MSYRLGIDVGGTFTDFVLIDEQVGTRASLKLQSTPGDPSEAILDGCARILTSADTDPALVRTIMHGTTVGTNALLEHRGARVGLLTTRGFREVLHLARGQTPSPYGMWITMVKPDPLADLEDTREIDERIAADGHIVEALDEDQVREQIRTLSAAGIASLTVALVNSYANPTHEQRIRHLAAEVAPELPVSLSSEISNELREYERTLTTVVNAYLKPQMEAYLTRLRSELLEAGFSSPVNMIRSDGGLMSLEAAADRPVHTVLSGPAGGVAGAAHFASHAGYNNVLTLDMGGTSTDTCSIVDGRPELAHELTLDYYTIRTPALLIHTVGAGGGSIAHVSPLTGGLRVGPESAGANPGPAAYGVGGTRPTVTDANVVLGHLPLSLLAGGLQLDIEAARTAVDTIGTAVGLRRDHAAQAIVDIVNENMHSALRVVSIQRGHDPRNFALMAYGGAGPLHANALARLLGAWPVIVPPSPGVLCAQGHVSTEFRHEVTRTYISRFDRLDTDALASHLEELGYEASAWLEREGIANDARVITYEIAVRYHRQGNEALLATSPAEIRHSLSAVVERYSVLHDQLYGFRLDALCETVGIRAVAHGRSASLAMADAELADPDATTAIDDRLPAFFDGQWIETPHYDRQRLSPGHRLTGPAIIVQLDSTTVVLPEHEAEVDRFGNLLIWPMTTSVRKGDRGGA